MARSYRLRGANRGGAAARPGGSTEPGSTPGGLPRGRQSTPWLLYLGVLLAEPLPEGREVLRTAIDWPDDYWFASPVRGGFGFFLGEVLINAVRHGRPGTAPAIAVTLDPVRRELLFEVINELPSAAPAADRVAESYGGRRILERLAHLCDWRDLRFARGESTFRVSWHVPVSQRGDPRGAD